MSENYNHTTQMALHKRRRILPRIFDAPQPGFETWFVAEFLAARGTPGKWSDAQVAASHRKLSQAREEFLLAARVPVQPGTEASAPVAATSKPFMYAIMTPEGKPSTAQGDALSQQSAPTAQQERAWYKDWLAGLGGNLTVDQIEFGRRAWAERARRAAEGGA